MGYGFKVGDRVITRRGEQQPDRVGTVEDVVRHFDDGSLRPAYVVRYDDQPSVLSVPLPGRQLEDYEPPRDPRDFKAFQLELRVVIYDEKAFDAFLAESPGYDWLTRIETSDADLLGEAVRSRVTSLPGIRCTDELTVSDDDVEELKNAKEEDDFSAVHDEAPEPF